MKSFLVAAGAYYRLPEDGAERLGAGHTDDQLAVLEYDLGTVVTPSRRVAAARSRTDPQRQTRSG